MKRIGVLTSGGDSPGMNAGIRAVARTAHAHGLECMGIERGFQGLLDDCLLPLSPRSVGGIIHRGGTILHSARCADFYEPEGRARAAETLRKHDIEGLVIIGGEGSYKGAQCLEAEHGIRCIGVPGTIDNDIGGTDYTIGFDTALNTATEAIDRLRDTADSHDRTFFVEVMGRHNGYLAMLGAIAGGAEHVLVPETPTKIEELIEGLRRTKEAGKLSSMVVIAEGDEVGDAATIARLVAEQSEFTESRVTVIGHLQRGGSPTAFDRILATRLGVLAVDALAEGKSGLMAAVNGPQAVLRPMSDSVDEQSVFDPSYVRISEILSL